MLKGLRCFFRVQFSLPQVLENLLAQQIAINLTLQRVINALGAAAASHKGLIEQQDTLRAFVSTVEAAGISRKFGSRIDVDYDKLLNNLGPDGEAEMMRTIKIRHEELRQRLAPTSN
jgi:hypothetical protein